MQDRITGRPGNHTSPAEEWHEIFAEVWRRYAITSTSRTCTLDWQKLRASTQPLVDHVAHRAI